MVDVINPAITANIGRAGAQINPMDLFSHFAATQNALNQNALFQQTFRARQALGPLAQQSVKPDGSMDWDKLVTLAAVHPETAFMAQDIANNAAGKKLIDAETTNQELNATKSRMDIMAGVWSAAAKDSKVNDVSDLTPYMSQAMSLGGIKDPKDAISFLADPKLAGIKGADFRNQVLLPHALAMQHGSSALTAMNNTYKEDAFHDANGNPQPGWMNPIRQTAVPAAGGPANALSVGPTNGAQMLTGGQPAAQPEVPQGTGTGTPSAAPQTGPNGSPLTLGPVGPLQKQLLDKQGEYQKNINDEATFAYKSDLLINELDKALKGVKTGAGTTHYVEAAKLAQTLGVDNKYVDEIAGGNLAHLQEAQKLMLRLATGDLRTALLPGAGRLTNTEFIAYREANPNWDVDPRAIQKLIAFQRQMNSLSVKKAQTYALAYGAASRGEEMPKGLPDITQFEPYWISKLQKHGLITPGTLSALQGSQ